MNKKLEFKFFIKSSPVKSGQVCLTHKDRAILRAMNNVQK